MPKGTASQELEAKVLHTPVAQGIAAVNGTAVYNNGDNNRAIAGVTTGGEVRVVG
jgi:hypothetical protein